jgi:hypothetical protein
MTEEMEQYIVQQRPDLAGQIKYPHPSTRKKYPSEFALAEIGI